MGHELRKEVDSASLAAIMHPTSFRVLAALVLIMPAAVLAEDEDALVAELGHDWAIVNYRFSGDAQTTAFEMLVERADGAVTRHPDSADLLIWDGIIKSSFAGTRGSFGSMSLAREAKASLEAAMAVDDTAMHGSAYASLGSLYLKVPGWPLGFGSDKKAVQLLEKALEIDPDGIDSNYFYADYLMHEKEYGEAERYLLKAQSAAPRPGRPIADEGRRKEILAALSVAREKLQHSGS